MSRFSPYKVCMLHTSVGGEMEDRWRLSVSVYDGEQRPYEHSLDTALIKGIGTYTSLECTVRCSPIITQILIDYGYVSAMGRQLQSVYMSSLHVCHISNSDNQTRYKIWTQSMNILSTMESITCLISQKTLICFSSILHCIF